MHQGPGKYPRIRGTADSVTAYDLYRYTDNSGGFESFLPIELETVTMMAELFRYPLKGDVRVNHIRTFTPGIPLETLVLNYTTSGFHFSVETSLGWLCEHVRSNIHYALSSELVHLTNSVNDILYEYADIPRSKAIEAMIPSLSTGFSLANFLFELKDFRSWFTRFRNPKASLSHLYSELSSMSLSRISRLISEGFLDVSLNILPGISDINRIIDILRNFTVRTRTFIDKSNLLEQRRHFKNAVTASTAVRELFSYEGRVPSHNTLVGGTVIPVKLTPRFDSQTDKYSSTPIDHSKYCAYMDFDYHVSKMVDINNSTLSLLQQFGLTPNASIIWNAVPFSFIVDWFFRVGDFLDRYASVDVISAEVNIHSWWESLSFSLNWDMTCPATSQVVQGVTLLESNSVNCISAVRGRMYTRLPIESDFDKLRFETGDGFDVKRAAISAALLRLRYK